MGGERWYVYGIVDGSCPPELAEHPARLVARDGVAAVARLVAADDFDEQNLPDRLHDVDWVTQLAVEHSEVLDRLREQATVLPMRICTVYRSEERLREMLSAEAPRLVRVLAHLRGRSEWGVKVFSVRPPTLPEREATRGDGTPGAGAAYLLARQRERDQIAEADQLLDHACDELHELLCAAAVAGRANPPQRRELLNGVYLVEDQLAEEFGRLAREPGERYAALGLEQTLTGPWPAYNFVPDHAEATT
ncbi:MAG TPA: GvpL/GvpF family gas vesicle protein [Solirubrobacteraceae bacterium]|nr:GvpL/GvpF family gas vesicle protein [Solirubrobacteraceae bacterium]